MGFHTTCHGCWRECLHPQNHCSLLGRRSSFHSVTPTGALKEWNPSSPFLPDRSAATTGTQCSQELFLCGWCQRTTKKQDWFSLLGPAAAVQHDVKRTSGTPLGSAGDSQACFPPPWDALQWNPSGTNASSELTLNRLSEQQEILEDTGSEF